MGKVDQLDFKTTGKQIIGLGWRKVYSENDSKDTRASDKVLPLFEKGEEGPHQPFFHEGKTSPPKQYTEATLLRSMEPCEVWKMRK